MWISRFIVWNLKKIMVNMNIKSIFQKITVFCSVLSSRVKTRVVSNLVSTREQSWANAVYQGEFGAKTREHSLAPLINKKTREHSWNKNTGILKNSKII